MNHLDPEIFAELEEIMEGDFSVLLETYLSDSKSKLDSLGEAFQQEDVKKVRDIAHGFKGSSLNIGAHLLAQLCEEVENFARDEKLGEASQVSPKIMSEFQEVKGFIEQKLGR